MIQSAPNNNIYKPDTTSFSNKITSFKNRARILSALAIITMSHQSQANAFRSNTKPPFETFSNSRIHNNQSAQIFFEAAVILEERSLSRLEASWSNPDLFVSENATGNALVRNGKPATTTDVVELKRSSNAFNVIANDSDPDGDSLILIQALANFGAVAFTPEGLIGYAQNPGEPRSDIITYTVSDGNGGFADGSVEIIVR